MVTEYVVDPDKKFARAIKDAQKNVSDLRVPFRIIGRSWFKSNRAIFNLKGPGKYEPLAQSTIAFKLRKYGFDYPALRAKGDLERSITNPNDSDAIFDVEKTDLTLGTSVPHGIYHQSLEPRSKIPFRPFLFIGAEQLAPSELNKRQDAWIEILRQYVLQASSNVGGPGAV